MPANSILIDADLLHHMAMTFVPNVPPETLSRYQNDLLIFEARCIAAIAAEAHGKKIIIMGTK